MASSEFVSYEKKENVLFGIVGAFIFSLVGGIIWFLLYLVNFLAGISGLIGTVCAIKGYELFSGKKSKKGLYISFFISLFVMVLAWYMTLSYDVFTAYKTWFANGEVDFALSFFQSVNVAWYFLEEPEIAIPYFKDLGIGLIFCIIAGIGYISSTLKKAKASALETNTVKQVNSDCNEEHYESNDISSEEKSAESDDAEDDTEK